MHSGHSCVGATLIHHCRALAVMLGLAAFKRSDQKQAVRTFAVSTMEKKSALTAMSLVTVRLDEALHSLPSGMDMNAVHEKMQQLSLELSQDSYAARVDEFLSRPDLQLDETIRARLRNALLEPVKVGDVTYRNWLDDGSRRIAQTFQLVGEELAEHIAEHALDMVGLETEEHYRKDVEGTDLTLYHPQVRYHTAHHHVEVKDVQLPPRGVRGGGFNGDSLLGFFSDPAEFTPDAIQAVDEICTQRSGYCYVPPAVLQAAHDLTERFRPNSRFALDMKGFVDYGLLPEV